MKKSLVALAVLAASGASFAQSVTLYGILDVYAGANKNKNNQDSLGPGSLTQAVITSGGISSNRWGMKGSEDLGGGLKANFKLEQQFNSDTGAAKDPALAFRRQSWVGFSGNFGEVRLGRTTTPIDDVYGTSDAMFDANFAPIYFVATSANYTSRPDNTIFYQAPSFAGLSGSVSYSLGENNTKGASSTDTTSLSLTYDAGPLAVQFGYQVEEAIGADAKYTVLGASYTVGPAVLKAIFGRAQNVHLVNGDGKVVIQPGADSNDYQLGIDYTPYEALTLTASYAHSTDNATGGDGSRSGYGLGANYMLSKRTSLYAAFEADQLKGPAAFYTDKSTDAKSKHSTYLVGVRHTF